MHFFAWRDSPLMVLLEIRPQRRKSLIHTHAQLVENIPLPSLVWCHYFYHIRQTLRVRMYLVYTFDLTTLFSNIFHWYFFTIFACQDLPLPSLVWCHYLFNSSVFEGTKMMHLRFIDNYSKIKEKKSKLLTTTSKTTRATTKITKATVKTTLLFGWSHGPLVFSIASSQGSFVSFIISKYDCPSVTQFLSNTSHSF